MTDSAWFYQGNIASAVSGGFVPKLLHFNSLCHPPRRYRLSGPIGGIYFGWFRAANQLGELVAWRSNEHGTLASPIVIHPLDIAPDSFTASPRFSFFFQAEDGIRDLTVTGVQTCALPI